MEQVVLDKRAGADQDGFYIRTVTGRKIYFDRLDKMEYDIEDIAHALALRVRWSGHVKYFYSIAQHSVMVSYLVRPENQMAALLHDASEAYLPDFPSPLKWYLADKGIDFLKSMEGQIDATIAKQYGFKYPRDPEVKAADIMMLATEHAQLMPLGGERQYMRTPLTEPLSCWHWEKAKSIFLSRFDTISAEAYR
jgi:uncharacterized protein